jgi:AMMECR1 domain-containing protein
MANEKVLFVTLSTAAKELAIKASDLTTMVSHELPDVKLEVDGLDSVIKVLADQNLLKVRDIGTGEKIIQITSDGAKFLESSGSGFFGSSRASRFFHG